MSETKRVTPSPWVAKGALIAGVVAALLVSLALIGGLTQERLDRSRQATVETALQYGGPLRLGTPLLRVLTLAPERPSDGRSPASRDLVQRALILAPAQLEVEARVEGSTKFRGIYGIPVYESVWELSGRFVQPDTAGPIWSSAQVVLGLDLRHMSEPVDLLWNGAAVNFRRSLEPSGAEVLAADVPRPWQEGQAEFRLRLRLKGSQSLSLQAPADHSRLALSGTWSRLSFGGGWLPDESTMPSGEEGFQARWSRVAAPALTQGFDPAPVWGAEPAAAVELLLPLEVYTLADRALKYSGLFVLLPLLLVLALDVGGRRPIHPISYALIGLSLALFFLLLLALMEHLLFAWAYGLAAAASSLTASWYLAGQTARRREGWTLAPLMTLLHLYLAFSLHSEDYALLIGSLGLFAVLALVMILTRRRDWYGLLAGRSPVEGASSADGGS